MCKTAKDVNQSDTDQIDLNTTEDNIRFYG